MNSRTKKNIQINIIGLLGLIVAILGLLVAIIGLYFNYLDIKDKLSETKLKIDKLNEELKISTVKNNEMRQSIQNLSTFLIREKNLNINELRTFIRDSIDLSKYGFEQGVEGWIRQDYKDSRACIGVSQTNEKVYIGQYSLKMDMNLTGNSDDKSKGEAYIPKLPNPVNLENKRISAWIYSPKGSRGPDDNPNGVQLFVKDIHYKCEYGNWLQLTEGKWTEVILIPGRVEPIFGYMDKGFNPARIISIGIKIGTGSDSNAKYSGPIFIDAVNWNSD